VPHVLVHLKTRKKRKRIHFTKFRSGTVGIGCQIEHYDLVHLKMRKKRKIIHFTKFRSGTVGIGCQKEHYDLVHLKMRKKRKIIHFTKHWLSFTVEHCVFVDLKMRKSVSKNIVC